jgi:hypothetical protein
VFGNEERLPCGELPEGIEATTLPRILVEAGAIYDLASAEMSGLVRVRHQKRCEVLGQT